MKTISFEELTKLLDKLETISVIGHHRTYQENKIKEAITAYDRFGIFKYIRFKPEYRKLIGKAQDKITNK